MGSTVGSIMSLGSSLFDYGSQHYENVRNQHFQHDEAALSREFNSQEADKSRQFQQQMYNQQVQENRNLIAQERQYNSPSAQVGRLQAAGINPAVYFGQGTAVASAQSHTVPTPGSSPAASVGMVSGTNQVPSLNFGSTFRDVAEGMHLAAKTDTENLLRSPLFQQAMEDVLGKKLSNDSMRILNYVQDNIKDVKIKQAFQDLANSVAQEGLATSETELNDAKKQTEGILQVLNARLAKKTQTEYLLLKNELGAWKQTYDQQQRVLKSEEAKNKAQAQESRASASEHKEKAATEKELRGLRSDALEISNQLQRDEKVFKDSTFQASVRKFFAETRLTEADDEMQRLRVEDERAYNALVRCLRGRGSANDIKLATRTILEGMVNPRRP